VNLPEPVPDRLQWPAFQEVGERLAADGCQGVLFSSSARPAGRCPCVFRSHKGFPSVRPVGSPRRVSEPPAPPRGMRT
jgi:hypothetical protein